MSAKVTSSIRAWTITAHCQFYLPATRRFAHATIAGTHSSSSKQPNNQYPYPAHRNPTPHQIFHLPRGATEAEIKARYYELVRLYHPDKAGVAASADDAHSRFQAITAAYDALRGKTALSNGPTSAGAQEVRYQTTAAYRAMQRRRQNLYDRGAVDDSKLDKWLIAGVVGTVLFVVVNMATTRREALAEVMLRSRTFPAQSKDNRTREAEERLTLEAVSSSNSRT